MNLTRLLVAAAVLGGGIGLAASAYAADPNALGTYTFEAEDGESGTWTVTPCSDPDDNHCVRPLQRHQQAWPVGRERLLDGRLVDPVRQSVRRDLLR